MDILHCPGHSGPLAKIKYQNGELNYSIAAEGIRVGDLVEVSDSAVIEAQNIYAIAQAPVAQLDRAAAF